MLKLENADQAAKDDILKAIRFLESAIIHGTIRGLVLAYTAEGPDPGDPECFATAFASNSNHARANTLGAAFCIKTGLGIDLVEIKPKAKGKKKG